ncbi:hypothetical protein ATANTOWER_013229 [Ataeniobius toweri]|uniref:Uncharacterized protein n=1 Tax=Ataeniobius toweri TaxID=208326 RepID=A0ABU7A1V6_9TELE|nr:hypothetical protein [Ataeniobius toweri]
MGHSQDLSVFHRDTIIRCNLCKACFYTRDRERGDDGVEKSFKTACLLFFSPRHFRKITLSIGKGTPGPQAQDPCSLDN